MTGNRDPFLYLGFFSVTTSQFKINHLLPENFQTIIPGDIGCQSDFWNVVPILLPFPVGHRVEEAPWRVRSGSALGEGDVVRSFNAEDREQFHEQPGGSGVGMVLKLLECKFCQVRFQLNICLFFHFSTVWWLADPR